MEFCAAAIVQSAHGAIVEKNYGRKCSASPSAIVSLILPLQKCIQEAVEKSLLTSPKDDVDWETQVLAPIISNFHVVTELGISAEDVEYLMLIATVLILAYNILLIPVMQQSKSTYGIITKIFAEYLCEPEIHHRIHERLQLEQHRLEAIGADPAIQGAVRNLRLMLPDIWTSIVEWERPLPEGHIPKPANMRKENGGDSRPFPRDLHIAVNLKPGQILPFEFVEYIDTSTGIVVIKTHVGIRMQVQPGFHVSEISGMFDSVTLSADNHKIAALAATIIVPPGYAYRATNVNSVFKVEARSPKTIIETSTASLEVSNGDHLVKRRIRHNSVLIESMEC